jgi:natural product precursor
MKTLSKLKLNQFSKDELNQRALNALLGGYDDGDSCGLCVCICYGNSYPTSSYPVADHANTANVTPKASIG